MGSFANSMFSVLLGWIRTASGWVWDTIIVGEDGGLIGWIGENWLGLIIALCVICMAVDAVIHLLRWRPYKVWASFFRRLFGKEEVEEPQHSGRMSREWHYADGTAMTEEVDVPEDMWYEEEMPMPRKSSAEMSQQYVQSFARPEKLKYQEELKKDQPVKGLEDYPQPKVEADSPQPTSRTERIRKRMARLTAPAVEDELQLRYRPVPPAVDKNEAYRAPFYPPQWKKTADAAREEETHDNAF
ncbi:MAG: hypothetical protein J6K13_09700 [Clostridia bacterium]|nr:hypothetical protein [Clostridia bacterium]